MGKGRKRLRRRNTEAHSLQAPQFRHQVIEKKNYIPEIEIAEPVDLPEVPIPSELMPIHPQDVEEMWPLANELIASELPKTDWSAAELKEACQRGAALLWMICKGDEAIGAMVTIVSPQTERCLVAICSGNNLWDYLDARHQLYGWAKGIGMKEVTFYGRDALVKLMPECKRIGVILRKEL